MFAIALAVQISILCHSIDLATLTWSSSSSFAAATGLGEDASPLGPGAPVGGAEYFGCLEGPKAICLFKFWCEIEGSGGAAGGAACFIEGIMTCLISGDEAESRDFGEVLFE